MNSERTPLIGEPTPKYRYRLRRFRQTTRDLQCCVGALLLALLIFAMVALISIIDNKINNDITGDGDSSEAVLKGKEALRIRDILERQMTTLQMSSPSYRHQKSIATLPTADRLARAGYATYFATKSFAKKHKYNGTIPMDPICDNSHLKAAGWCPNLLENVTNCQPSRYRSVDGSCNNLQNPTKWGVAFTQFRRSLPPNYADGIGTPRISENGTDLPSAATISAKIHRPSYRADDNFNVMLAVWGQFLDHDLTSTALSRGPNGTTISCCTTRSSLTAHPECFPVLRETPDGSGIECVEFVRSAPASTCCFGPRQQLNQMSSYLDGSVVYGAETELVKKLRLFRGGKLKMLVTADGRELLPVSEDPFDGCNRAKMMSENKYCFVSGDARANENLHLVTMHLLWARHHNRIAETLHNLNPLWSDDRLFNESRHIVAAQLQHIAYAEFLPLVVSYELAAEYDLLPMDHGYYYGYDSAVDASVSNAFAAAAFRFAHTLIPALVKLIANDTNSEEFIELHKMLFNPFRLYDVGELDKIIRGAVHTIADAPDPYFTTELKNHLFEDESEKKHCGLDLVALNIQRGRDHGLPGYVAWRHFCNLSVPETFQDLAEYVDGESLMHIASLYNDVNDIDLYTGALAEHPLPNSLVGSTASCIIVDQFIRMKRGDRFWYETPEAPQAFTPEQLSEIRRTTLATIICANSDQIDKVPESVMKQPNKNDNAYVDCFNVQKPNFKYWKEN